MSSYTLEKQSNPEIVAPIGLPLGNGHYTHDLPKSPRMYDATLALLNQTQTELDHAKQEIATLQQKIKELEQISTTDSLTGIKNLRGFQEALAAELDRTRRGISVGGVLVMIDLNGFKAINDTYGHQAGDMCLKLVGQTLHHDLRKMDCAARLGGDEFVLILTNTSPELVAKRVQMIASRINNLSLIWENHEISLFASVGMKPYNAADHADDIIAQADQAMYANKKDMKEGRVKH